MKLIGYTYVYNVEEMIPYVMPYIERMGYDKFIVYDDNSTDHTVEMLQKYPYIEIRKSERNGSPLMPSLASKQLEFMLEISNIALNTNEIIWVTCTDFDEVIYFNKEISVKGYLEAYYKVHGMNYFAKEMINILPPKGQTKIDVSNGELVHTVDNVRGSWGGMDYFKPTMFCINDYYFLKVIEGNHTMNVTTFDDKPIINIADEGAFHTFHLKYVNKELLEKAYSERVDRDGDYDENLKQLNDIFYNRKLGTSFLMENYFLLDGLSHKINKWNSLTKI